LADFPITRRAGSVLRYQFGLIIKMKVGLTTLGVCWSRLKVFRTLGGIRLDRRGS